MKNAGESILRILTGDGSYTLYRQDIDEIYHSRHGAVTESRHVYIQAGLVYLNSPDIQLLEVGFGTGLNAFLAWQYCVENSLSLRYTGLDPFPLPAELCPVPEIFQTDPNAIQRWNEIQQVAWDIKNDLPGCFILKQKNRLQDIQLPDSYFNLVFFDAFAPAKDADLWTVDIFKKLFSAMQKGGILTTYCAMGQVRRNLQSAGFRVERIAGPPGKREMLRANKL